MYRYLDAVVVRAAACEPELLHGPWPDVTGQQAGPASWRPWLQQVMGIPEFMAALELATPVLADRMQAICGGQPVSDRTVRRVVLSVMRYLLRATGRATPYGLFAGVAPARVADIGTVRLGTDHRAVARIQADWLASVIDQLEADPHLRPYLMVRANNLLTERSGHILLERASHTPGGAPIQIQVRATAPVRAALVLARNPIRLRDLADKLGAEFGVTTDTVSKLLSEMVAQRLLLTSLRPPMTATDPLSHIAAELGMVLGDAGGITQAGDGLAELCQLDRIRDIIDLAARHNSSGWSAVGSHSRQLAASLAGMSATTRPAVAVDLRLDCELAVPKVVMVEAERAAEALVRLARPTSDGWSSWHRRFLERFGPHALVPVLDAVDDDVGLGYPRGYRGAPPAGPATLTDRDRKLLALAQRAALHHQHEVVLDDDLIADLAGENPVSVQPSTELTVRVHAPTLDALHRGEFSMGVIGVSRAAGRSTGRFLDLFDPDGRAHIAAQYAALPTATRDALIVQISAATPYATTEDVARAPQVMPFLLPVAEYHDNNRGEIALSDIAVTADVHRLYLVCLSQRRPVEPVVLNAVEPANHTLPIVRFLTEAPAALATPCSVLDWGPAAGLPFLPAVRYGRTTLSPARWLLSSAEVPGPGAGWQEWSRSLNTWLDSTACPQAVYLGEGDQRIMLHLAEAAHQALLRDHLRRSGNATLRTTPSNDTAGWIGGRAHEIVIPMATTIAPAPPPRLPTSTEVVAVRAHGYLPGGDGRVYVKLYGHPDRQTLILSRYLPSLIDGLDPQDRWWFLRYGDPEPHLRLRLAGIGTAAIAGWAHRLRQAGLVSRIQFDTDYPETGRFGGAEAMAAAEEFFAADSAAALAQVVATDHQQAPNLLALTAASLLDLTTALIGDTAKAMRWMIDHARPHRSPPPRVVYDQAVLLGNPDSRVELATLPQGEQILSSWDRRRRTLAAYRDALRSTSTTSATDVLPDLLHLHHTRMAGLDLNTERICLHLARAAALSWTARQGAHHVA